MTLKQIKSQKYDEGLEAGRLEGETMEQRRSVRKMLAKNTSIEEIADFLEVSLDRVRELIAAVRLEEK